MKGKNQKGKKIKQLLASPRIELGVRDYETLVLPLHQEALHVSFARAVVD